MNQWAVVDVETSGLHPNRCRVLSVAALRLDPGGMPEGRAFTSLIDAAQVRAEVTALGGAPP